MSRKFLVSVSAVLTVAMMNGSAQSHPRNPEIERLTPSGNDFVNANGDVVKLWGVNLTAFYPDHELAEKTAANLAHLGYNYARPHHNLRRSKDWNPDMVSGALMDYRRDSRTPDPVAWDRFDHLNARLRQHGIYLALAIGNSRAFLPNDYEILDRGHEDNMAWREAIKEMNRWNWQRSHDVVKMLPIFDERAALIHEAFARRLLSHVNPYTGLAYAHDPQVVTLEVLNEFCANYAVICKNRFPDYMHENLEKMWHAYLDEHQVPRCDFYAPSTRAQIRARNDFIMMKQTAYFNRIEQVARDCGYVGAITFSNLFHGDASMRMKAEIGTYTEDHAYVDPRIARQKRDFFQGKFQTRIADKPYVIGEFNYAEWGEDLDAIRRERAMLPLVVAAYGSFNDWAGLVWFSWNHGERAIGRDGWGRAEGRVPELGDIVADGMLLDHMRTSSLIFRNQLAKPSIAPQTVHLSGDFSTNCYYELMRGVFSFQDGWQAIHAIRKQYGPEPEGDATKQLLATETPDVLVSDTGELVKDTEKQHLTLQAPAAVAFAGVLKAPDTITLSHFSFSETDCFATLMMVSRDTRPLAETDGILLSRTTLNGDGMDVHKGILTLTGIRPGNWRVTVSRPREKAGQNIAVSVMPDGSISFPIADWHACEVSLH